MASSHLSTAPLRPAKRYSRSQAVSPKRQSRSQAVSLKRYFRLRTVSSKTVTVTLLATALKFYATQGTSRFTRSVTPICRSLPSATSETQWGIISDLDKTLAFDLADQYIRDKDYVLNLSHDFGTGTETCEIPFTYPRTFGRKDLPYFKRPLDDKWLVVLIKHILHDAGNSGIKTAKLTLDGTKIAADILQSGFYQLETDTYFIRLEEYKDCAGEGWKRRFTIYAAQLRPGAIELLNLLKEKRAEDIVKTGIYTAGSEWRKKTTVNYLANKYLEAKFDEVFYGSTTMQTRIGQNKKVMVKSFVQDQFGGAGKEKIMEFMHDNMGVAKDMIVHIDDMPQYVTLRKLGMADAEFRLTRVFAVSPYEGGPGDKCLLQLVNYLTERLQTGGNASEWNTSVEHPERQRNIFESTMCVGEEIRPRVTRSRRVQPKPCHALVAQGKKHQQYSDTGDKITQFIGFSDTKNPMFKLQRTVKVPGCLPLCSSTTQETKTITLYKVEYDENDAVKLYSDAGTYNVFMHDDIDIATKQFEWRYLSDYLEYITRKSASSASEDTRQSVIHGNQKELLELQ